jgi:hypothetical protein
MSQKKKDATGETTVDGYTLIFGVGTGYFRRNSNTVTARLTVSATDESGQLPPHQVNIVHLMRSDR